MKVLSLHKADSGFWRMLVNGKVHPLLVGFKFQDEAIKTAAKMFPDSIFLEEPKTYLNWTLPGEEIKTPFELPPIIQESISLGYLINLLKDKFSVSYMPLSTGKRKLNNKPDYVNEDEIRNLSLGTNLYTLSNESLKTFSFSIGVIPIEPYAIYVGLQLENCVEILVNLNNPFVHTFIRFDNNEANKNAWLNWTHELVNIDKHVLKDTLEENF
jgi:hypothetical protein